MTVLSIAGFALGLNTMRDRGGVVLLTKVFWRFGTLVERVSETNYDLHSTFKKGSIIRNMLSAILFKQVCMYSEVPNRRADQNKRAGLEESDTLLAYLLSKLINEQGGIFKFTK